MFRMESKIIREVCAFPLHLRIFVKQIAKSSFSDKEGILWAFRATSTNITCMSVLHNGHGTYCFNERLRHDQWTVKTIARRSQIFIANLASYLHLHPAHKKIRLSEDISRIFIKYWSLKTFNVSGIHKTFETSAPYVNIPSFKLPKMVTGQSR